MSESKMSMIPTPGAGDRMPMIPTPGAGDRMPMIPSQSLTLVPMDELQEARNFAIRGFLRAIRESQIERGWATNSELLDGLPEDAPHWLSEGIRAKMPADDAASRLDAWIELTA